MLALVALALAADPSAPVCAWSDARWDRRATLSLPGTREAFATVSAGFTIDGELGADAAGAPVLRARFSGAGVTTAGDIDPRAEPVFVLEGEPLAMGPLVLVAEAPLVGHGVGAEGVSVGPVADEFVVFEPAAPPRATVPCARLGFARARGGGSSPNLLEASGLPASRGRRNIDTKAPVRVHAAPGGAIVGVLPSAEHTRDVELLEARGRWSRVADISWAGTYVWHGWIRAPLRVPEPGEPAYGLGGLGSRARVEVRRCAAPLPLSAAVGGRVVEVGTVGASVPVQVLEPRGDLVSVRLHGRGLTPIEGGALLLPKAVLECPVSAE